MAEYYDSETLYDSNHYDNPQLKRLNEVLDSMTDEELERKVYEVECKCEGLDPDHPESPKRLNKIKRQYKWKHHIWPFIRNTFCWMLMIFCTFTGGKVFAEGGSWYIITLDLIGGLGWFITYLSYKFGSDFLFK